MEIGYCGWLGVGMQMFALAFVLLPVWQETHEHTPQRSVCATQCTRTMRRQFRAMLIICYGSDATVSIARKHRRAVRVTLQNHTINN